MTSMELCWRVEQACANAWPSTRQITIDGWAVKADGGPTRRTDSANPLHPAASLDEGLIDQVETVYRRLGRRVLFRVPDMVSGIDERLARRGYASEGETRTLYAEMATMTPGEADDVTVEPSASADWLAERDRLREADETNSATYRAVVDAILLPCGFAAAYHQGRIGSIAIGVVQDDLLVFESVLTDPALRQLGLGRRCVSGLIAWGRGQGATACALQVQADNAPARRLYAGVGLTHELYSYHYRASSG